MPGGGRWRDRRRHRGADLPLCKGSAAQQRRIRTDGAVVGVGSGECLDASGNGTANGTLFVIWTCGVADNQKWSRS
ncbi:RICIN domain-containing protein [Allocatelliglobosispora scoriae]|uniref:RICIN domain-containing protein n=1 Tax=Allocatelliglobosispora scoriae TaxID=643052 RepID=UPI0016152923